LYITISDDGWKLADSTWSKFSSSAIRGWPMVDKFDAWVLHWLLSGQPLDRVFSKMTDPVLREMATALATVPCEKRGVAFSHMKLALADADELVMVMAGTDLSKPPPVRAMGRAAAPAGDKGGDK
jgi:hypothetical protein